LRLVILDAYTANPGDLSWGPVEALADCTIYDRTAPADVLARVGDADAVMLNKGVLNAPTIAQAPHLKYVGILATGGRANRRDVPARPPAGVEYADLDRIFAESDVVSLHCPLTPATAGLVNARRLAQMKPTAFLINTSRGPLVVEAELAAALRENRIAGAAVDVLSTEPPAPDNPLLSAPRCLVTPHVAWATDAARQRLIQIAADNLRAYLEGRPVNLVPLG
jgi:phosphoglycerate dehydrogenase-like enzyme